MLRDFWHGHRDFHRIRAQFGLVCAVHSIHGRLMFREQHECIVLDSGDFFDRSMRAHGISDLLFGRFFWQIVDEKSFAVLEIAFIDLLASLCPIDEQMTAPYVDTVQQPLRIQCGRMAIEFEKTKAAILRLFVQ